MNISGPRSIFIVFVICTFLLTAHSVKAADGALDLTFSGNGKLTIDFGADEDFAGDIAVQHDGKIVVAGYNTTTDAIQIIRILPNGSLDATFSGDGRASLITGYTNVVVSSVAIYQRFRIYVGAHGVNPATNNYEMIVAAFTLGGTLDTNYGTGGVVKVVYGSGGSTTYGARLNAMALQPNGNLVLAGARTTTVSGSASTNWAVVRLAFNGDLDGTFGSGGRVNTDFGGNSNLEQARGIALLPSGKILVGGVASPGGNDFGLALYTTNGSLDTSFDGDGRVTTDFAGGNDEINDVLVTPDGRFLVAGQTFIGGTSYFALARYNVSGSLDETFDEDGKVFFEMSPTAGSIEARDIELQADGKIVVVGDNGVDFALARLHPNGSFDANFGTGGRVFTDIVTNSTDRSAALAIQADGRLLVAGTSRASGATNNFAVCRYLSGTERARFDYDGDLQADVSVFRPSGDWFVQRSTGGFLILNFGIATDKIVPAHYDGDGKTDIAVYRPSIGTWYIANSSNGTYTAFQFGIAEDIPVPGDYDADGLADFAVFRPSIGTWYVSKSSDGSFFAFQFGTSGDKPIGGDFDGDRKADLAVFRSSNRTWYFRSSSSPSSTGIYQFGLAGDMIVPADYDGDGKVDHAVYRPSNRTWYVRFSTTENFKILQFGSAGDIPVPADYDGDGLADIAMFRPSNGTWYIDNSINSGFTIYQFGLNGDTPTPSAFN